jgi:hypothetical protein
VHVQVSKVSQELERILNCHSHLEQEKQSIERKIKQCKQGLGLSLKWLKQCKECSSESDMEMEFDEEKDEDEMDLGDQTCPIMHMEVEKLEKELFQEKKALQHMRNALDMSSVTHYLDTLADIRKRMGAMEEEQNKIGMAIT